MRHKKAGRQFGRDTSSRRAMLRNLAANLITHERIETTDAKAKELRRIAERLISKAKRIGKIAFTPQADLSAADKSKRIHAERLISSYVPRFGVSSAGDKVDIVEKVMVNLTKRFETRAGGYTRIIKLGPRRGDGAPLAMIELVDAAPVTDKVRAAPAAEAPSAADAAADAAPAAEVVDAKVDAPAEAKSEEKSE